ncbi:hypothetical protein [Candidatus Avelusimicrobium fimicolum]|uniref:hypothetical protein n=1 Tax=Candidatus Avelusimicrobium fimicolum TaxID=3416216 RepID=UPI003D1488CA
MRRCWKYDWKFCRHDGPCESCQVENLAKKVKESGKILAQANNNYRNSQKNLEKAKLAVERAKADIDFALKRIGGRAARFYQVENEPEVQDADTDTGRNAD